MNLQNTYTANTILSADPDAQKTDYVCKAVLKSRWVLANILKGVISEYADTPVHEIAETYIEPDQIETLSCQVNGFRNRLRDSTRKILLIYKPRYTMMSGCGHCCQTVRKLRCICILMWKPRMLHVKVVLDIRLKRESFIICPV